MKNTTNLLFLFSLLLGCAGTAVKRDYDASVDFQKLKTYAWVAQNGPAAANSLVDDRIRHAVDGALAAKGYSLKSPGEADFLVGTRYALEKETGAEQVSSGLSVGSGFGGGFGAVSLGLGSGARPIEQEVLAIDLLDPGTDKLIWRGSTRRELVQRSDPAKAAADMNATVRDVFSKFPPKKKR